MSLRTKLFLSVGTILLIVAILSYLLPEIWIKKDIDKASYYLNEKVQLLEKKLVEATSFLVSFRLLQNKAELEGSFEMLSDLRYTSAEKGKSPLTLAAIIATYNPDIAFVQIMDPQIATVIPEDAKSHSPLWAKENEKLFISIEDHIYEARLLEKGPKGTYLLFSAPSSNLTFAPFEKAKQNEANFNSKKELYESILQNEQQWVNKIALIRLLADNMDTLHPEGILQVNAEHGPTAILSREVFSNQEIGGITHEPTYLLRNQKMDLAQAGTVSGTRFAIGFSFSQIVQKTAKLLKRPILIVLNNKVVLAYSAEGDPLNVNDIHYKNYVTYKLPVDANLSLEVLSDQAEINSLQKFLNTLKNKLIGKISINLIGASFVILLIALFLLGRISKKITKPIAQLADASQEIGKGKYEGLHLPKADKRKDEVAVLVHSFENMVISLKEREKIRGLLNKVVSKEIASEILKGSIELKGEERVATILFNDIRGFTHLSEKLDPRELIGMLNDYMTEMCRIVDETQGVVDKFVGDEIMALYGVPLHYENHAEKATTAALLMMAALQKWNEKQKEKNRTIFESGIGIHTGVTYAGSMGAENRLNYTVVGANVNLASRICGVAAPMQVLISEETLNAIQNKERFHFKKLEPISLKGLEKPVTLYEVTGLVS